MNGLHPNYAKCTIVAIEFRAGEPTMVRMVDEHGGELLAVAGLALTGKTLAEVRRLERPHMRSVAEVGARLSLTPPTTIGDLSRAPFDNGKGGPKS